MSNNGTYIKRLLKRAYLGARGLCIRLLIRSRKPTKTDPDSIRSILVVRIDRIGDMVISLPAIKALNAIFPNARISVLARRSNAALLANVPYIAEVIPYAGLCRSAVRVRKMKFDIAVDMLMDYSIKTAAISFLSGAPLRAGFDIASRGRFFNIAVAPGAGEKHMSEYTLDIIRAMGAYFNAGSRADWDPQPRLTIGKDAIARAELILSKSGISRDDRIVAIHPGGHFPSQRWMPEAFAELSDRMAERHKARVVIIGSEPERRLIKGIVSLAKTKPAFVAGLSIDLASAVISMSRLLVCNNSGLLHIAAAVGTPTVSTMGPTVPYLWRPLGSGHTVIRRALGCSPCNMGYCRRHECMKEISVDEMETASARLLEKGPSAADVIYEHKPQTCKTDKILVINLGGIGDALLSTPALRALKNTYPGARLYFLGIERVNEFIRKLPYVDEVLSFDLSVSPLSAIRNIKSLFRLNRSGLDMAINMRTLVSERSALKIRLLLWAIAPKVTVGRDTEGLGYFFDVRIPESRIGDKPEMEYDLDTVRALGGNIVREDPDFVVDPSSLKRAGAWLDSHGVSEKDMLIGIHPGGKPSHRWPAERFARVMGAISGRVNTVFVITGDSGDAPAAEIIKRYSKSRIIDATGRLGISELGAVIRRCSLYICNDTAAMHIAAALKVPMIAIFGPGYLRRFDPRNISKDAVVIIKDTACAPCDKNACVAAECLKSIAADEVISAALKLLKVK